MTVMVETTNAGRHVDVTPATLERLVHQASDANPYLIVTRDDRDGFAQAHVVPPKRDGRRRFRVEYRDGSDSPMRSAELVLDRAVGVLLGWGFDRAGWTAGIRWHTEELESVVDLRGQCAFSPVSSVSSDAGAGGDGRSCRLAGDVAVPELAALWDVVGVGSDDDRAFAEFVTRTAELLSGAEVETRVAWGRWLGNFVVKVPRESSRTSVLVLDESQEARIRTASKLHWPDGTA